MEFEEIKGYKNREFPNDDCLQLVLTIKFNTQFSSQISLFEGFQIYIMKKCGLPTYISDYETQKVLRNYAKEILKPEEYFPIEEYLDGMFIKNKSINARTMAEAYLIGLQSITMRYKIGEDV